MLKAVMGVALLVSGTGAWAATDFGIRTVEQGVSRSMEPVRSWTPVGSARKVDLRTAAGIGSKWGRVTSTVRTPAHNRRVGGVRNSFHLSGRAIDIARRPGISHRQIEAAFRNAGYRLIESLDEGDHSHFAFGTGAAPVFQKRSQDSSIAATRWGIVTVASAILK